MTHALLSMLLSAGALQVEPKSIAFGPNEATLEFTAPAASTLRVWVPDGAGAVSTVEPLGSGRFRARYTLPAERFPRVVLLAAQAKSASGIETLHWVSLPLIAKADLKIETKPGAKVTVAIGTNTFGPAVADGKGKLTLAAQVAPGARATMTAVDRAGNQTTTPLELPFRPFARAVGWLQGTATPDTDAEIQVFAIEPDGRPLRDASALKVTATQGQCAAPSPRGEGVFSVAYRAPQTIAGGRDTVSLVVDAQAQSHLAVPLSAGKGVRVSLTLEPAKYAAGFGQAIAVRADVVDAYQNKVAAAPKPTVTTDFGQLTGDKLDVPDNFGGRTHLTLHARSGTLEGQAELPLEAGPGMNARLELPRAVIAGEAAEGTVAVFDAFGNETPTPPEILQVTSSHGRAADLSCGTDSRCKVSFATDRSDALEETALEVRLADKVLAREPLQLTPYQRPWAFVATAQLGAQWNFSQARAFNARVSVGARVARTAFDVALEGGFALYPLLTNARTLDGINDGAITSTAWSLAAAGRYTIPLRGRWAALFSAAVGAQHTRSNIGASNGTQLTDSSWGWLARGGAGLAVHVPRGRVLALLEYAHAPARGARVRGNLGGAGLNVGYWFSF